MTATSRKLRTTRCWQPGAGFTLVEMLVTMAVIAVLVSMLLPALRGAMTSARGFRCQMSQRSVAFDFSVFADSALHGDRGDDALLGGDRFTVETFQESQYGVDEFWRWGNLSVATVPDESGNNPMRCPEIVDPLELRDNSPCSGGAVGPAASVSYAFNLRLHRAEVEVFPGTFGLRPVVLSEETLDRPDTPLLIDVDGKAAARAGAPAVYTAPSAGSTGPLGGNHFWFPSGRHGGSTNIAFVGGHVLSSRDPAGLVGWGEAPGSNHP